MCGLTVGLEAELHCFGISYVTWIVVYTCLHSRSPRARCILKVLNFTAKFFRMGVPWSSEASDFGHFRVELRIS